MNRNRKTTVRLTENKLRSMIQEAVDGAMAYRRPAKKAQPKRLTESRLRNMINEAVKNALKESAVDDLRQRALSGDIDAWVEMGAGSPGDWNTFDKWRRENSGMSSRNQYYNDEREKNSWVEYTPDYKFTH